MNDFESFERMLADGHRRIPANWDEKREREARRILLAIVLGLCLFWALVFWLIF